MTRNATGIKVSLTEAVDEIQICGNFIASAAPLGSMSSGTGIDLTGVQAGSDWITIVGNTIVNMQYPIALPSPLTNLGPNCRMTDNQGYNPPDAGGGPAVPASGTAVMNPYFSDAMVAITPGATTVLISHITLTAPDGSTQPYLNLSGLLTGSVQVFVPVPCGYKITLMYTHSGSAIPLWNWIPT
jgi:hypothetical protein